MNDEGTTVPSQRESDGVRRRGWMSFAVLVVIGLSAGGVVAYQGPRVAAALPDACDEVLYEATAAGLLSTDGRVSTERTEGDRSITCRWTPVGDDAGGEERVATLTVTVTKHQWYGGDTSVERVRSAGGWAQQTTPPNVGEDAVVASKIREGKPRVAHAEAGVHDGRRSYQLVYTAGDGDRAMAATIVELAARQLVYGGRQP